MVADYAAYGILLTSDYWKFLIDTYHARVTNVRLFVELTKTDKLSEFVREKVEQRIAADECGDALAANLCKAQMNSSYGCYFIFFNLRE